MSSYALDEVRYWAHDGRLKGLKIHFANSEVNLRDAAQVRRIAAVVALAGKKSSADELSLEHAGDKFGAEDTEIFIRDILGSAPGAWVQLSHAGGFGGSDDPHGFQSSRSLRRAHRA